MALPVAFGAMSFVKADWNGFENGSIRGLVAVVVLLFSLFRLWQLIGRALGRWVRPFQATPWAQTPA